MVLQAIPMPDPLAAARFFVPTIRPFPIWRYEPEPGFWWADCFDRVEITREEAELLIAM